ncbi:MAG: NAD(P)/FAD-dependent oxidoreductase [Candidatus Lokiarchaeota archaeon]|nr:NAD(P)/FAD-dependent oxidoreductase [Candidatus Lokiarchaeota archaeon]
MSEKKKVIIIGAGVAGLCAGSYLQMNGYATEIYESHNLPGGLCTSWKKGDYTFDGCIHSLSGINPDYNMYHYWNELVNMEEMKFHFWNILGQIETKDGRMFSFSADPDKLEKEIIRIAPEDEKFIRSFIKGITKLSTPKFGNMNKKPIELFNPLDFYLQQFKIAPYIKYLLKWGKSIEEMVEDCTNPILKHVLMQEFFRYFPAYFFLISIGQMHDKNVAYPIGGSLKFAQLLEEKYRILGGSIHYNSKVVKINVLDRRATGITLENGDKPHADIVISAADFYSTMFTMLEGNHVNKKINDWRDNHPVHPSMVLVSLGISRGFEKEDSIFDLFLKNPLKVDNQTEVDRLSLTIYNFDPTLAPPGKTCLRVIIHTKNHQYWTELRQKNKEKYSREKSRIAGSIIDILEEKIGNVKQHVEVIDVATPATVMRYTDNWQGSIQGWVWIPGLVPKTIKKKVSRLKNLYQIGQWVLPGGGISAAMLSGRDVTRIICKKDKIKFRTKEFKS